MKKHFFESAREIDLSYRKGLDRRSQHLMTGRLLLFFAAIFAAAAGYDQQLPALYALAAGFLIAFARLLQRHTEVKHLLLFLDSHLAILSQYLGRFNSEWHQFTEKGDRYLSEQRPQGTDLNLFGPDSIYQYLCAARTRRGRDRLAEALSPLPGPRELALKRQQGTSELIHRPRLCIDLQALSSLLPEDQDTSSLLQTIQGHHITVNPWLRRLSFGLPLLALVTLAAAAFGLISWAVPGILYLCQLLLASLCFRRSERALSPLFHLQDALQLYYYIFQRLENSGFSSPYMNELQLRIRTAGGAAHALHELARLSDYADMRRNYFFFVMSNLLCLWDLHCTARFARWQQHAAKNLGGWIDAWSEIELLMSFAVIGQTRRQYTFPELLTGPAPHIEAEGLSYLLLPEDQAVANDTTADAETRIITGSNMSGKTTYLRTLASAAILAYAGAPVGADRLALTPLAVFTSIRITDDLSRGLSTFYAELLRIKSMVEFARQQTPMLICIDEIFKGTNSADRIIGARAAIEHLTSPWSITLVSTHDFELCDLTSPNTTPVVNYHFAEHYEGDRIAFDFKLKPGRCQTTNAQYLLKMAGIIE